MIKEKIVNLVIIFFICIMFFSNIVYSFSVTEELGEDLSEYAKIQGESIGFKTKIQTVLNIISSVGSLIAIVMLIILGIKYMTGSIEEKAEYKKTLKPYVIGALMIFGITNLLSAFYGIISNTFVLENV